MHERSLGLNFVWALILALCSNTDSHCQRWRCTQASAFSEFVHTLRLIPTFPLCKWITAARLDDTMSSRKHAFGKVTCLS